MNAPLAGTQGFTMTGGSGAYGGGNGAFQLGAANTITGPVTVNSGWLVVNAAGSLPVGAPVTVSGNNAVLAGTGTVNDTVTLTTGYIYPGSAAITSPGVNLTPGTLTVGNLTWNGGSINETLGTASSLLSVNNALTMGSASTYNFNITQGAGFSSGNTYDLLNFNSESGVTSSSFTVTGVPAGMEVVTEWTVADQSGEMILVPEPSTLALLVGGVAGLWQMRRRKA
jgi:autotransporter-associated beta strand protein